MNKSVIDVPEWFHGCHLNYAENLLKYPDDKIATITYGELPYSGFIS